MKKIARVFVVVACMSLIACESQEEANARWKAQEQRWEAEKKAARDREFEEQLQRDLRRKEAGLPPERPIEERNREEARDHTVRDAVVGTAAAVGTAYVLGKVFGGKRRK